MTAAAEGGLTIEGRLGKVKGRPGVVEGRLGNVEEILQKVHVGVQLIRERLDRLIAAD